MKDPTNAYDVVNKLLADGRIQICENELNEYEDSAIILAILKSKYNAKYYPSEDFHFCGDYCFDNPSLVKKPHYALYRSEFNSTAWESCREIREVNDENAYRICRDIIVRENQDVAKDKMDEVEKKLFDILLKNKVYVSNHFIWKLVTELYY